MLIGRKKDTLPLDRCAVLEAIEFHFDLLALHPERVTSSAWEIIFDLLKHSFPSSLKHMKIVCIPDSQNLELFRFSELERLLTASNLSLESLTFEDALAPGDEHKISENWEKASSCEHTHECQEPRVLGYREFRDTVMAKMPGVAASGVLRVTSQGRGV